MMYSARNPNDDAALKFWSKRFSKWPEWQAKVAPVMEEMSVPAESTTTTAIFFGKKSSPRCPHYTAKLQEDVLEAAGIKFEVDACIQSSYLRASK